MASSPSSPDHPGLPHPDDGLPHPHHDLPHPLDPGSPDPQDHNGSGIFENYNMNSKIIISTLGILFFVVFLIVVLHMYTRLCWQRGRIRQRVLSRLRSSISASRGESSKAIGLDKEIVEAMPIFTYMPPLLKGASQAATFKAVECPVCLSEFQREDSCKLLPKCKHFFHVDCIDMWFLSHMTCPLCRAMPTLLLADEERGGVSDEQMQETQRALQCIHGSRNGNGHDDEESDSVDGEALLHASISRQPRTWQRSFSDKFPCGAKEAGQSAAADTCHWSNNPHGTPHFSAVWGRSLSHTAIDTSERAESLVGASISSLVSPRLISGHLQGHHHLSRGSMSVEKLV